MKNVLALLASRVSPVLVLLLTSLGLGSEFVPSAQAVDPATTSRRLWQEEPASNGSYPNGCVLIDITVAPEGSEAIKTVQLWVGSTKHTVSFDRIKEGDPIAEHYQNGTYWAPPGWNYDGILATQRDAAGRQDWYATWSASSGGDALAESLVFTLVYCGNNDVEVGNHTVQFASDADGNPLTGILRQLDGHAPTGE